MFDFTIPSRHHATCVAVKLNVLNEIGSLLHKVLRPQGHAAALLVTDKQVGDLYGPAVLESLTRASFESHEYRFTPGEGSKSLQVVEDVYRVLAAREIGRDGVIVALGGGVASDLAGFVAATWMRGIDFAICPTTLEADVDASIGGKTAVNIPGGKNLVGAFHQPVLVATDPSCLASLDIRDVRAGMAESIKHALISSPEFVAWHELHAEAILTLDSGIITELILRNVRIKAAIVERDAHERSGERMLLNLGHTIGHAIEASCGFVLRHGECVALGTLAAGRLSQSMGLLDKSVVARIEQLLGRFGLPKTLPDPIDAVEILTTLRRDKKARGGKVQFVLLEDIGRPVVRRDIPEELVRQAYESLLP